MSSLRMLLLASALCLVGCHEKVPQATATGAAPPQDVTDASANASPARTSAPTTSVLFRNVRVFNGIDPVLTDATDVLVRDNRIVQIGKADLPAEPGMTIIDGGGRTLMPGLIDNHWHSLAARPSIAVAMTATAGYLNLLAAAEASDTLQRGFTTVRDVGGASFGLKRAIDEGWQAGPRIYPSGAIIAVTSGHGDFRSPDELPRALGKAESRQEIMGDTAIADTPDEVRVRAREQLMRGASQIKLTAGGGVSSPHSPLDVVAFTPEELRAAVLAANNWGTYVAAHAFTPEAIRQSVEAGVQSIEHGVLMDEALCRLEDRLSVHRDRFGVRGLEYAFALADKHRVANGKNEIQLMRMAAARMECHGERHDPGAASKMTRMLDAARDLVSDVLLECQAATGHVEPQLPHPHVDYATQCRRMQHAEHRRDGFIADGN